MDSDQRPLNDIFIYGLYKERSTERPIKTEKQNKQKTTFYIYIIALINKESKKNNKKKNKLNQDAFRFSFRLFTFNKINVCTLNGLMKTKMVRNREQMQNGKFRLVLENDDAANGVLFVLW